MAVRKITAGWIKKISGGSLEPGQSLQGKVIRARMYHGILRARVQDGAVYLASARLDPDRTSFGCTCHHPERVCRHVAAALLHASENLPEMILYERRGGPVADHLLEGLTAKEAREIAAGPEAGGTDAPLRPSRKELCDMAVRRITEGGDAFGRLADAFGREISYRMECAKKIGRMFKELDRDFGWTCLELDFEPFFQRAKAYENGGDCRGAAAAYQGISEAIADNMDLVDDSNGYYADQFQKAVRGMVGCIKQEGAGHPRKRHYVSYLHERFVWHEPDYFEEFYDAALRAVCTTREDLEYWKSLHEPLVPEQMPSRGDTKHYRASTMVKMMAHILEGLGEPSLERLCGRHYRSVPDICQIYVDMLAGRDSEMARRVAEEAASLFPWVNVAVPKDGSA